jgi:hypothetical protein
LVPGLIHSLASTAPGAARLMRPPAKLLKISAPSDVAVMLSARVGLSYLFNWGAEPLVRY